MFVKLFKVSLLTLLAYLLQACAAFYVSVSGVAPNLAIALIAIGAVALGAKYAFVMSLSVGYLLEIMLAPLSYLSLILYPVCCVLSALSFGDKSERKLEELREKRMQKNKSYRQLNPHLRTVLCALQSAAMFEAVNLVYTYLSGVMPDSGHIGRAVGCVAYTAVVAGILQFPVRAWLGVYHLPKAE